MKNNFNEEFFSNLSNNNEVGFLLWKVNNYWQREFKKSFGEIGLTHSQVALLASTLWGEVHNIEITQKELSNKAGIDPMTTSTVLRTLQKRKLIKRKFNKKDSRTRLISLTEEGKIVAEQSLYIIQEFNDSFFSSLQEQLKQFKENLKVLLMSDDSMRKDLKHEEELKQFKNINIENN